jgi:REP element-mobilizing transposase RayT
MPEPTPTPRRHSPLRHPTYDYSTPGAYFFTVVTIDRGELFGSVRNDEMILSPAGDAVDAVWNALPSRHSTIKLDAFVVMPNHMHGIVWLLDANEAENTRPSGARAHLSLGQVIRAFKSLSAIDVNRVLRRTGAVWQRNYYEKVVRSELQLNALRKYIEENPIRWAFDEENKGRGGPASRQGAASSAPTSRSVARRL